MKNGIDFIGDIHGYADELQALLKNLGYKKGVHPEGRIVVFLGDYIDRGPKIREVITIVHDMTLKGSKALMGNHELNAVLFRTPDLKRGGFLRKHTEANMRQHSATLNQLGSDLDGWLPWMKSLPLWEAGTNFQAIHACWDPKKIASAGRTLADMDLQKVTQSDHPINTLLKGMELRLPEGKKSVDKEGVYRDHIRVKWWENPEGKTYKELLMPGGAEDYAPETLIPENLYKRFPRSPVIPTFVGHYWLKDRTPARLEPTLACIDYSIAKKGLLCAYRFDGEKEIDPEKFLTHIEVPKQKVAKQEHTQEM